MHSTRKLICWDKLALYIMIKISNVRNVLTNSMFIYYHLEDNYENICTYSKNNWNPGQNFCSICRLFCFRIIPISRLIFRPRSIYNSGNSKNPATAKTGKPGRHHVTVRHIVFIQLNLWLTIYDISCWWRHCKWRHGSTVLIPRWRITDYSWRRFCISCRNIAECRRWFTIIYRIIVKYLRCVLCISFHCVLILLKEALGV